MVWYYYIVVWWCLVFEAFLLEYLVVVVMMMMMITVCFVPIDEFWVDISSFLASFGSVHFLSQDPNQVVLELETVQRLFKRWCWLSHAAATEKWSSSAPSSRAIVSFEVVKTVLSFVGLCLYIHGIVGRYWEDFVTSKGDSPIYHFGTSICHVNLWFWNSTIFTPLCQLDLEDPSP